MAEHERIPTPPKSGRITPDDVVERFGGSVICYDERGNIVPRVVWVDPELGTFGQHITDEDGHVQIDPGNPNQAWVIERIGKLRLERKS